MYIHPHTHKPCEARDNYSAELFLFCQDFIELKQRLVSTFLVSDLFSMFIKLFKYFYSFIESKKSIKSPQNNID